MLLASTTAMVAANEDCDILECMTLIYKLLADWRGTIYLQADFNDRINKDIVLIKQQTSQQ